MTRDPISVVRGARGADGALVDLRLADGLVVDVATASARPLSVGELDADGMLVLAPGAEPHAHLDKALVVDDTGPVYGGLLQGIAAWQRHAPTLDEDDFVRRGLALARRYLANGVTAVRTHAEIFPSADPLRSVRALVRVRQLVGDALDLQIAVLPKNDIPDEVVHAALDAGADLVGGSPHTAADPAAEVDRLIAIARERGVGMDIHADERLDPGSLTAVRLARAVADEPLAGTVTASHCVSLGLLEVAA
ncbi:MAG: cytosine deaminase, partial [Microbacterium sp.]